MSNLRRFRQPHPSRTARRRTIPVVLAIGALGATAAAALAARSRRTPRYDPLDPETWPLDTLAYSG